MKTMSHDGEPRRTTVVNEAGWGRSSRGDSTGQGGCRSSLLGHPARSFFRAPDAKIGKPPVEAARAVDAKNAPTAPWKTAQNAVSHSSHRPFPVSLVTGKVSPMFPVNFVTYVPGCTRHGRSLVHVGLHFRLQVPLADRGPEQGSPRSSGAAGSPRSCRGW